MDSSDRIHAIAQAMTPSERLDRFGKLKEVVARQGGILLDSDQTEELVTLGRLLGVRVEYVRVDLPTGATPAPPKQMQAQKRIVSADQPAASFLVSG